MQIWIEFCRREKINAEAFYEDAIRDLIDINRSEGQHDERLTRDLARAQALIDNTKKPHEYRTTTKAARMLGAKDETTSWEKFFRDQNKLLSKFVHPTALSVVLPLPRHSVAAIQKQLLVEAGEEYAKEGLDTLHGSFLKALHDQYEPLRIGTERRLRAQRKVSELRALGKGARGPLF